MSITLCFVPLYCNRSNSATVVDWECLLTSPSNLASANQDGLSASDSNLAAKHDSLDCISVISGVYQGRLGSFIIANIDDLSGSKVPTHNYVVQNYWSKHVHALRLTCSTNIDSGL